MMSYTCTNCNNLIHRKLTHSYLIVCSRCGSIAFQHEKLTYKPAVAPVPSDWSFLQPGAGFEYNGENYFISGRIRLQLCNDYKNFWCAGTDSGSHVWLMESFMSVAVFNAAWTSSNKNRSELSVEDTLTIGDSVKVKVEYVERCTSVTYEGELGEWKFSRPDSAFVQASNNDRYTAVFMENSQGQLLYLFGIKTDFEKLKLKNMIVWDEWK